MTEDESNNSDQASNVTEHKINSNTDKVHSETDRVHNERGKQHADQSQNTQTSKKQLMEMFTRRKSELDPQNTIQLPFVLYPEQNKYKTKITEIVQRNQVALMEASTGFGKTIANIVGILELKTGQNHANNDGSPSIPFVVYVSRSHTQNTQVVKTVQELNKINSADFKLRATQMASRKQLCLIKDVREAEPQEAARLCKAICERRKKDINKLKQQTNEDPAAKVVNYRCRSALGKGGVPLAVFPLVTDLQTLKEYAEAYSACPYKTGYDLIRRSHLFTGHYYYFFSPPIREVLEFPKNSVLVVDEGHNIEEVCCSLMSRIIDSRVIFNARENIIDIQSLDIMFPYTPQLNFLTKYLLELFVFISDNRSIALQSTGDQNTSACFSAKQYLTTLEQHINRETTKHFISLVYEVDNLIYTLYEDNISQVDKNSDNAYDKQKDQVLKLLRPVKRISTCLKFLYEYTNDFGVIIEEKTDVRYTEELENEIYKLERELPELVDVKLQQQHKDRIKLLTQCKANLYELNAKCLNPEIIFQSAIQATQASIVCSGTLSPLDLTAELLGVPDAECKRWNAIIPVKHTKLITVPVDEEGTVLQATHSYLKDHRKTIYERYKQAILSIAEQLPGGILVFCKSYQFMKRLKFSDHHKGFSIYKESRSHQDNNRIFADYRASIEQDGKAMLISVFGGKNFEGKDFPDDLARGVIICGIPYAPYKDPAVKLKKAFYDSKRRGLGWKWYEAEAFRKISQALGRGWRHIDDYCIGFLLDERFLEHRFKKQLPQWLRNNHLEINDWLILKQEIISFFNNHSN